MTRDEMERRHADWNDLATLAEHGHEGADGDLLAHLAVCADCMAAYAEAVRARDLELAGEPAAATVPARPAPVFMHPATRRRRWGMAAWGTGGLAAAAVLLFLVLPGGPEGIGPDDPRFALQARLVELSQEGPLLPGVDRLGTGEVRYRAGDAATPGLDALLEPWTRRFGADPADSEAAYWLGAGYLATGRLNYAEDVLRRALQRHPEAAGLRHLYAVTAYRLNELDRAEAVLRDILADRPDDGTARFNLALIEYETRRLEEARADLERLAAGDASAAVRARARELLALLDR